MRASAGRKAAVMVVTAGLAITALAPAAVAGGNWIELNRRYMRVGARVTARAVFFTRSKAKVLEHGPYFAYLAPRRLDGEFPNPSHPLTVPLGRVAVLWPEDHSWHGLLRNNPKGRITFEVPDIPLGNYVMSFCNRPCTRPLGDVDTTSGLQVVRTADEGRLRQQLSAVRARMGEQRYRLHQLRVKVNGAEYERDAAEGEATNAQRRASHLERVLATARGQVRHERALVSTLIAVLAVVALGGVGSAFLIRHRRRRRFDDELRAMLAEDAPASRSVV